MQWELAVNIGAAVGLALLIWRSQVRVEDRIDNLAERVARIEGMLSVNNQMRMQNGPPE